MQGKVKWFNDAKGFGFIERPGERDVFVHFRGVIKNGQERATLLEGEKVEFEIESTDKGPAAIQVRVVR